MQLDTLLTGRRVIVTGAARSIGAALVRRLYSRGARVALLGLEPDRLREVARSCGDAPNVYCDVTDGPAVEVAVESLVERLGGLDVIVANAGVAAQLALVGGDAEVMRKTLDVNVMGTYHTIRAAGPHLGHSRGYVLALASAAAAAHLPLMGAYSASKAAVEALCNTLRIEMKHLGTKVGTGYLAEIDTDMTAIGFDTRAAAQVRRMGPFTSVSPLETAISALERGIAHRSRTVCAPGWVHALLPLRGLAQRLLDIRPQPTLAEALRLARSETVRLTTPQPHAGDRELA